MLKKILLLITFLTICAAAQAAIKIGQITWLGEKGYSVISKFAYEDEYELVGRYWPDTPVPVVDRGILRLYTWFYKPNGSRLDKVVNLGEGLEPYLYLKIAIDVLNKEVLAGSFLDLGQDPGYYIGMGGIGAPDQRFSIVRSLINDNAPVALDRGYEYEIDLDVDDPAFLVPDGVSTISMLFGSIVLVLGINKRVRV